MELASSQSYANFRAWVPRNSLPVGVLNPHTWNYYDWGPRSYPEPLVCFHSIIGSAESFYPQLISLPPRGYRIISIQLPVYWTVHDFCDAFHAFVEILGLKRFHLLGAGLGGFLAMQYAVLRPERVASMLLIHSFLSTAELNLRIPYSVPVLKWLPDFLIRFTMRALLPKGKTSLQLANAAEFAIGHTLTASRDQLASRLALSTTDASVVGRLHLPESHTTLIDTLDRTTAAAELSTTTATQMPNAKRALLNHGGDFPYLSVPDEVNILITVHLRRHSPLPQGPMPVPPPARPRPLPSIAIKRRQNTETVEEPISNTFVDVEDEAKAVVRATERARIERFALEITRLREFLKEQDDSQLAAVMEDCEGDLEMAIGNALAGEYDDQFYEQFESNALETAIRELQIGEVEPEEVQIEVTEEEEVVETDPLGSSNYLLTHQAEEDTEAEKESSELSPTKTDDGRHSRTQSQLSNIDLEASPMESKKRRYPTEYPQFLESGSKELVGRGPAPYDGVQPAGDGEWNNETQREGEGSQEADKKREDTDGELFSWQGVFPESEGGDNDDKDGWDDFRRGSQKSDSQDQIEEPPEKVEEEIDDIPLAVSEEKEGEDLRLKEWSMSAQQATQQSR